MNFEYFFLSIQNTFKDYFTLDVMRRTAERYILNYNNAYRAYVYKPGL